MHFFFFIRTCTRILKLKFEKIENFNLEMLTFRHLQLLHKLNKVQILFTQKHEIVQFHQQNPNMKTSELIRYFNDKLDTINYQSCFVSG